MIDSSDRFEFLIQEMGLSDSVVLLRKLAVPIYQYGVNDAIVL